MARVIPIGQLASVLGEEVETTVRAIKIALFNGVIRDTRVGNPSAWAGPAPAGYVGGRLRGNWQITTGAPAKRAIDRIDPTGESALKDVKEGATAIGRDFLTNNLPYAAIWNERDAIIDRNAARIDRIVKEAVRG